MGRALEVLVSLPNEEDKRERAGERTNERGIRGREKRRRKRRRMRGDKVWAKIFGVLVFAAPNESAPAKRRQKSRPRGPKLPPLRLRLPPNYRPFTGFTYGRFTYIACTRTHSQTRTHIRALVRN